MLAKRSVTVWADGLVEYDREEFLEPREYVVVDARSGLSKTATFMHRLSHDDSMGARILVWYQIPLFVRMHLDGHEAAKQSQNGAWSW